MYRKDGTGFAITVKTTNIRVHKLGTKYYLRIWTSLNYYFLHLISWSPPDPLQVNSYLFILLYPLIIIIIISSSSPRSGKLILFIYLFYLLLINVIGTYQEKEEEEEEEEEEEGWGFCCNYLRHPHGNTYLGFSLLFSQHISYLCFLPLSPSFNLSFFVIIPSFLIFIPVYCSVSHVVCVLTYFKSKSKCNVVNFL